MGVIHKFSGSREEFNWEKIPVQSYDSFEAKKVVKRVLIGEEDGAPYFVMRYFEVEPGGWTALDQHSHDHGVLILKGKGTVLLEDKEYEVKFGDAIYIPPNERHQLKNTGDTPFGFICVIPNKKLVSNR